MSDNNDCFLLVGRILLGLIYAAAVVGLLQGHVPIDFASNLCDYWF